MVCNIRVNHCCAWTLALMLCFPKGTNADQFVSFEGYEIHYSTFSSLIIPADVAKVHGITRAKNRIITNISVRQNDKSVTTAIQGTIENLLGQVITLEFTEVLEQDAIYYLANHVVDEKDRIKFDINIKPTNSASTYHLKFSREYY